MPTSNEAPHSRHTSLGSNVRGQVGRAVFTLQGAMSPMELILPHDDSVLAEFPPVFIVGAPRCGSTLLMQVLAQGLDVSYLSNRHSSWAPAPSLIERFARPTPPTQTVFASKHGRTPGASGPAESGRWWYRFFPRDPVYVSAGQIGPKPRIRFRRSLASLTAAANRPVLFKNLYASMRIREIAASIPEARFIHLTRNVSDNAHSLLEARSRSTGSYTEWFSLPPPGWLEVVSRNPAEQVVWQVNETNAIIDRDLDALQLPQGALYRLTYEEFCAAPKQLVRQIANTLHITAREPALGNLPDFFEVRSESRIPDELVANVRAAVLRTQQ